MRKLISFSAIGGLAVFAGCTMAPDYKRPESPASEKWPSAEVGGTRPVGDVIWQDFYKDEKLQKVIALALENNRDMRVAALNVEKLRAQYRIQRANLAPSIYGSASETKTLTPGDLAAGTPLTVDQYTVKAGVTSWELDLFGRVRSLNAQALETYLASESTRESVRISLIAEVVDQYLSRISLAENLRIASDNLVAAEKSRDLTLEIRRIGQNSDLDVQSALAEVESAKASVASYERQLAAADNALALVVGCAAPDELLSDAPLLENISLAGDISAGLPSELLARRPDIIAAEHALKAANANIGAARAAFFPKIALTGSYGTASAELNGLFKGGSEAWTFAPTISVPIFSGGANKASLDAAKIEKRIEIASYEKAIQTAFREVADVLVSAEPLKREMEADQAQVAAQKKRLDLATERYKSGLDSYLVVLTAQQAYFSAQKSLVAARLALIGNRVTFYKVLGGGWAAE